jgi:hypothetical protein
MNPFPALILASLAAAQTTAVTLPTNVNPLNIDRPFAGGIGRYQQYYTAAELRTGIQEPMRIERVVFFSGTAPTANATSIDMEVSMAHSFVGGPSGLFEQNYTSPPVVVVPRTTLQLTAAAAPNLPVLTVNFVNRFQWDYERPVVIEFKIFGNSRGNQPFIYNMRGTASAFNQTNRVYVAGSASAISGNVQQGWGLVTEFTARRGVNIAYGSGCAGEGQFVPEHAIARIGQPGISWVHTLSRASSQRLCCWVIGDSRTNWQTGSGPVMLPLDLAPYGAGGCSLLASPLHLAFTTSIGGGAGLGTAVMNVQLPPVTNYVGLSVYTQWFVFDPLAVNQMVAGSGAMWSIIAPLGP